MPIKTYRRGAAIPLTANFNSREFDCKGGACCRCGCTSTPVDTKLVRKLQVLRRWLDASVGVNSGYRCKIHNRCQGGSSNSYHMRGQAADIRCSAVSAATLAKRAQELGFTGIGLYSNRIHVDTRSKKYFYRVNSSGREIAVTTHGGTRRKCPHQLRAATLRVGSTGTSVRALQWILDWAGYPCGVDGDFGKKTEAALKAFQKDMYLDDDGIAGPATIAVVREVYE